MKKIGFPFRYRMITRSMHQALREGQEAECELPASKRQRLDSSAPAQGDGQFSSWPISEAAMMCAILGAKVDLANAVLAGSPKGFAQEIDRLREIPTQCIPSKRRIDSHFRIEEDGIIGGYRLRSYDIIWPILMKSNRQEHPVIDIRAAAIAEISANLEGLCQDPRVPVARLGAPGLSEIGDVTEPEGSPSLTRPHSSPCDTKSPTKREPLPTSPIKARRLSETMVRLLPASSPQVASSPTKSASPPSTPLVEAATLPGLATTSPIRRLPVPSSSAPNTPALMPWPVKISTGHGRGDLSAPSSPFVSVPSSLGRPVEPTPPRRSPTTEASTPHLALSAQHGARPGPLTTPQQLPSAIDGIDGIDASPCDSFDFGHISSTFNSPAPVHSPLRISCRASGMNKASRRKSEPLVRRRWRSHAAPRKSTSPQKLSFSNKLFVDISPSAASSPLVPRPGQESAGVVKDSVAKKEGFHTPQTSSSPDVALGEMVTPAISWAKMTGRAPPASQKMARTTTTDKCFSVDMRRNLDIFGGAQTSIPTPQSSVDLLARMAADSCDGEARVVVTQADDRIFVRFKLPVEHASKFPVTPSLPYDDDSDSLGRDYMRDFIKRSRPRKSSTTETGSPMAAPGKRQPLGAKNPNTESPQKRAGTADVVGEAKRQKLPGPHDSDDKSTERERQTQARTQETGSNGAESEKPEAAATRRSSRLQHQQTSGPKPSISGPAKAGTGSRKNGRATGIKQGVRKGQDVVLQTRTNTRNNRGAAMYPTEVLARQALEEAGGDGSEEKSATAKGGKNVGWKEPLVSDHQPKAKRGRGASKEAKAKTTQGKTGMARPTRASAGAAKQHSGGVTAALGTSTNGTPGRGRVTRSSARQKK
ncbi:hypothetical protein DCS_06239 [Drechmeria coniospora]|uniref:Uncharacterized protein n=1 Tax=Drechmeria coniospora TaxID=98403 RepID=A0A151GB00_DRECN|nr:hypothetical protein DCS_06239 [Drechmeria coniospora]KYK54282.1 hypothetical protein DCS_06239 [Drechmeria coniospora]